ncbi:Protein PEROXIN-4 [Diplonema papillatum]|nr:Protein PEROXIN-4 [Diplonema papillatum]
MSTRLSRELRDCVKQNGLYDGGAVKLCPKEGDPRSWKGYIKGPEGTPYEGGVFELDFSIPHDYPLVPVEVRFVTKLFHPNVRFDNGEICLDILKASWSPAWTIPSVCQAIRMLLSHPAEDSPLNCDAGNLLRANDHRGFNNMAKMYTVDYAHGRDNF